jgi:carbon monoxide dehydrogenase subunit G
MHFEGKTIVKASVDKVWNSVSKPESAAQCLPGVEEYRVIDGKSAEAKMKFGVALFKTTFEVTIKILEEDPQNYHARLSMEGSGVSAFKAEIQISCNPHPEGTEVGWGTEVTVSGSHIPRVVQGLIEGQSQKLLNQTLECMTQKASQSS